MMKELLLRLRGVRGENVSMNPAREVREAFMPEFASAIDRVRGMAIAVGIQHLFRKHHFDVCHYKSLIEAAGVIPDGEFMRIASVLHCVDWADMPVELRKEFSQQIVSTFIPKEVA